MADSYTVRMWNSQGLPRDAVSTENGILVTRAGRWALTIDPQEQVSDNLGMSRREVTFGPALKLVFPQYSH